MYLKEPDVEDRLRRIVAVLKEADKARLDGKASGLLDVRDVAALTGIPVYWVRIALYDMSGCMLHLGRQMQLSMELVLKACEGARIQGNLTSDRAYFRWISGSGKPAKPDTVEPQVTETVINAAQPTSSDTMRVSMIEARIDVMYSGLQLARALIRDDNGFIRRIATVLVEADVDGVLLYKPSEPKG